MPVVWWLALNAAQGSNSPYMLHKGRLREWYEYGLFFCLSDKVQFHRKLSDSMTLVDTVAPLIASSMVWPLIRGQYRAALYLILS